MPCLLDPKTRVYRQECCWSDVKKLRFEVAMLDFRLSVKFGSVIDTLTRLTYRPTNFGLAVESVCTSVWYTNILIAVKKVFDICQHEDVGYLM